MLAVKPKRALAGIHDAVHAATRAVTGSHDPDGDSPPWIPHISLCCSTAEQAMAPDHRDSRAAARECQIQISTVSLVIQHGPAQLWDWRAVGAVYLPASVKRADDPGHRRSLPVLRRPRQDATSCEPASARAPFRAPLPGFGGRFRGATADLVTVCASQHGHATGPAFAVDDGQALVLDQTSKGVRVVEADDAGHELVSTLRAAASTGSGT